MQTICGMAAAADTVRALGDIALNISGSDRVNIDSDGMKSVISGKNTETIAGGVAGSGVSIEELNRNISMVAAASSVIAGKSGNNDISDQFDKFSKELVDGTTGQISVNSLSNYLAGKFGGVVTPAP